MEKVILKEKISGDTRNNKNYYKRKKPKNKVVNNKDDQYKNYDDLVLRSGEVSNVSFGRPKMAGSYMVGNNNFFYLQKKPNSIHRFFTKLILGWVWKDVK